MPDLAPSLVRHRLPLLASWAAVAAFLFPRAAGLERSLDVGARVAGSESAEVERELATRFGSPYAQYVVLVVSDGPAPTTPAGRALQDSLVARLDQIPGVAAVRGYSGPSDSLLVGRDGRTALLFVGLDGSRASPDALIPLLRAATANVRGATLRWTGQTALNADLRRVSADDARTAERRVLPLTLVLLLVAFGTLVAASLPVLAGGMTIGLAFGAAALLAARWPLSIMLQNVVSMIGLGLGIDYALLAVSRFREARVAGLGPRDAAIDTVRHAGHTVALSGLAVAVGFAGLLAIPVNELRSVGVGGLLTVAIAVLIAVTLLPASLSWLGNLVDWGRAFRRRSAARGEAWRRWGGWVARRPYWVLLVAGVPVAVLAWQARRMVVGEPTGDWLPPHMESAVALRDLVRAGRSGLLQELRVVLELPPGSEVQTARGWAAARRVQARLAADSRVGMVRSITSPDGVRSLSRLEFLMVPDSALRSVVARDRRGVLFDVVPREEASVTALNELARELRRLDPAATTGLAGTRLRVGGLPAFRVDYLDAVGHALPFVAALIVAGTLVTLAVGFRSVLVPLKAVALNLLSVACGFGSLVLVFQDGHGVRLFGLAAPVDQVFVAIPALVFCAVFGLSMDYEVFLVARVAEARRSGLGEAEAIAEGLARTAPVITSAAAVMVVVFGGFALGEFLMMRMLGLALAVTVLVDAAVVRTAIGPALLALAGRWNWWPGEPLAVPRRLPAGVAFAATVALGLGCSGFAEGRSTDFTALGGATVDRQWLGAARFTYDDFGGINTAALETNAIPWKVATAALALDRSDRRGTPLTLAKVNAALEEFGFIVPRSIANWPPHGPPPRPFERPLGIVTGYAGRGFIPVRFKVEIANLGCAACHAGVTYDARGMPQKDVWLGLPNTSIDLEAFTWGVYRSLNRTVGEPRRLLAAVRTLYPGTDSLELTTIRELLLPRIERRLAQLRATIDAPGPFPNGSPGATNGVGALKRQLGVLPTDARAREGEVGFTSIPALGDVLLRSSLLADGSFTPLGDTRFRPLGWDDVTDQHVRDLAGMVAFFTVPAMGNPPDRAEGVIPRVDDVLAFVRGYEPPRFPGPIDSVLARAGRDSYRVHCAECHGMYDASLSTPRLQSFPNRFVSQVEIGTDPARLDVLDTTLLRALKASAYRRHVDAGAQPTRGYVAARLSGVWATAPYLHNGSVPTLWHLMHPESRPARFYVGGHRLDLERVGIAGTLDSSGTWRYRADYVPWSEPHLYDTALPGLGNGGHTKEFEGLSEAEKRALLEYFKLL